MLRAERVSRNMKRGQTDKPTNDSGRVKEFGSIDGGRDGELVSVDYGQFDALYF